VSLRLADFDFDLPERLIARYPGQSTGFGAAADWSARLLADRHVDRQYAICRTCCAPATCSSSTIPG
jgi:hypothetical protein